MGESSTTRVALSAPTGTNPWAAKTSPCDTSTNVQDAERPRMELRDVVSERRHKPLMPLVAEQWESHLLATALDVKYPIILKYIQHGTHASIPQIHHLYTPLNNESTVALKDHFNNIIQSEFNKDRYLGPFQSSPLSLVPKAKKPRKYCLIQNLSHPHSNHPTPSINSYLDANDFPCTWGTFCMVCALMRSLPSSLQAATRDISEAYWIIPLHESQWAGIVVQISNHVSEFALNTSTLGARVDLLSQ